ncbi:hypothetical protein UFOVP1328_57 [uncultured Caudovirales phage]|uniref:Gene product 88 domain-containing protein n=1 Tax=uncultured Caudovirales phage TaxID=2100421 RepID=A0A6J5RQN1_9CAUD|nr:hypothetical protein UFOVP1084_22 [uncultured Caudovirales phage]CAB4199553.1 hypothetical protein UFOVP1328_57 [uncultured Caudovirales phage]CAB5228348.1 hypothetical protein UFOVP1532_25 [uncultured Caudovirales phage]
MNAPKFDLDRKPNYLLTNGESNPKTAKSVAAGYETAILHLSPASKSGRNVCPHSSPGCRAACLDEAGHGGINLDADGLNTVQAARIQRTRYWARDRQGFLADLVKELESKLARATRRELKLAARLNGTSDLPFERWPVERNGQTFANIMEAFPEVTFYDYTKWPTLLRRKACPDWPTNYTLTFSLSETNATQAAAELAAGVNVAAPFTTPTTKRTLDDGTKAYRHSLPPSAMIEGIIAAAVDGDLTDLRFLDKGTGVIVGLRAKGTKRLLNAGVAAGFILPA